MASLADLGTTARWSVANLRGTTEVETELVTNITNGNKIQFGDVAGNVYTNVDINDTGTDGKLRLGTFTAISASGTTFRNFADSTDLLQLEDGTTLDFDSRTATTIFEAQDSEVYRYTSSAITVPNGVELDLGSAGFKVGGTAMAAVVRWSSGTSVSLNWGATAGAACDSLTITGAGNGQLGDICTLGIPTTAPTDSAYYCKITTASSTAPVATIFRCCAFNGETAGIMNACSNPAADTYSFASHNP